MKEKINLFLKNIFAMCGCNKTESVNINSLSSDPAILPDNYGESDYPADTDFATLEERNKCPNIWCKYLWAFCKTERCLTYWNTWPI